MEKLLPNMEKVEENYKVPNLEKGIAVLEYLSLRSAGETLQDIKSALDISQTTAYRILNTLVRLEYLYFNEETKKYKLSQEELALAVGVTRQTIISLEREKYTASLVLAYKIARYFGVTIEDVFDFSEVDEEEM